MPTLDWDTYSTCLPNCPILTVLSEKASMIGRPAAVLTENKDPESESSTEKRRPEVPSTVNALEPEALIARDPEINEDPVILAPPWSTIRPFLTLNSFGIRVYCFHYPTAINKYCYVKLNLAFCAL